MAFNNPEKKITEKLRQLLQLFDTAFPTCLYQIILGNFCFGVTLTVDPLWCRTDLLLKVDYLSPFPHRYFHKYTQFWTSLSAEKEVSCRGLFSLWIQDHFMKRVETNHVRIRYLLIIELLYQPSKHC